MEAEKLERRHAAELATEANKLLNPCPEKPYGALLVAGSIRDS